LNASGSSYGATVFIDTMVVLEGPPLNRQPWSEIHETGPILVIVLPQVQAEIDKRKRDGRLAERARAFNRLIGPSVDERRPVRIADEPVAVDLILGECDKVDYEALDLDPAEGDHRVVGQMLRCKTADPSSSILVSHDLNPIAVARGNGLKAVRLSDHWLLPPETSPKDKEIARLKAENKELRKDQPELQISIEVRLPSGFEPMNVLPLSGTEELTLASEIERRNNASRTRTTEPRNIITSLGYYSSGEAMAKFRDETIPAYIEQLPESLQAMFNQVEFELIVENAGAVTASNLVVEVRTNGGRFDTFFHAGKIGPPSPPKGQDPLAAIARARFPELPRTPGDHELHWGVPPGRSAYGELHCREFQQGRRNKIDGFFELLPSTSGNVVMEVRATASNLTGDKRAIWSKQFSFLEATPFELMDREKKALTRDYPLKERVIAAAKANHYPWLRFTKLKGE